MSDEAGNWHSSRLSDEIAALEHVQRSATDFLVRLDALPAIPESPANAARASFDSNLPELGRGTVSTIQLLASMLGSAATRTSGPKFHQLVVGGVTPAALAADWLVSLHDQNTAGQVSSPIGTIAEMATVRRLVQLVRLPAHWDGLFLPSATFATVAALATARDTIATRRGIDIAQQGMAAVGPIDVIVSERMHPTIGKALHLLGIGFQSVHTIRKTSNDDLDREALERTLANTRGGAIMVASAGEANVGTFDPIEIVARMAERYGAWLHIDAAIGLFGRLSPDVSPLLDGIERADSIAGDAHKWLNAPFDTGLLLVPTMSHLRKTFRMRSAPYIGDLDASDFAYVNHSPEGSRRMRCLPVWASLEAYGRVGIAAIVNGHIQLASRFAQGLAELPGVDVVNTPRLPIVCFRVLDGGARNVDGEALTRRLHEALQRERQHAVGLTVVDGEVCIRVAIFSWRTQVTHVDALLESVSNTLVSMGVPT